MKRKMKNKVVTSYPLLLQKTEISQWEEQDFFPRNWLLIDFYLTLRRRWRMGLGSYHILMGKKNRLIAKLS